MNVRPLGMTSLQNTRRPRRDASRLGSTRTSAPDTDAPDDGRSAIHESIRSSRAA